MRTYEEAVDELFRFREGIVRKHLERIPFGEMMTPEEAIEQAALIRDMVDAYLAEREESDVPRY